MEYCGCDLCIERRERWRKISGNYVYGILVQSPPIWYMPSV